MTNKKLLSFTFMIMMSSIHLVEASSTKAQEMIQLTDLNEQTIYDFTHGKMRDSIIECPKGSTLPLTIEIKGSFLELHSASESPLYLTLSQTCYVRCNAQEKFLFSSDLRSWKPFSEFFTGEIKASLERDSSGPLASLQIELNKKP